MKTELWKQILVEANERKTKETFSKNQLIVLEQSVFKSLLTEKAECCKCGRKDQTLTLDHIVPKDIVAQFGRDFVEGNYRLLCRMCNSFKSNKLDFADKKTKEILLKLLEKI